MHIHVLGPGGELKVWIEPIIEVANSIGLSDTEIGRIVKIVREHEEEIRAEWNSHFRG